jgi:hypothetical protein
MTPKEKAKELTKTFMAVDSDSEMFDGFKMGFFYAQRCALKCVDEIIKSYPHTYDLEKEFTRDGTDIYVIKNVRVNMEYWNQVKQEIEKL